MPTFIRNILVVVIIMCICPLLCAMQQDLHLQTTGIAHSVLGTEILVKNRLYTCTECLYASGRELDLVKHIKDFHTLKQASYRMCDKELASNHNVVGHFKLHRYMCAFCEYTTPYKQKLMRHSNLHKVIFCSVCNKIFTRKSTLTNHFKMHTKKDPVVEKCFDMPSLISPELSIAELSESDLAFFDTKN